MLIKYREFYHKKKNEIYKKSEYNFFIRLFVGPLFLAYIDLPFLDAAALQTEERKIKIKN